MGVVWSKQRIYLSACILSVILLVSMFFALQKPVNIEADGKVIKSRVFFSGTVGGVLKKNHITLKEKDKVVPSLETAVSKEMKIVVTRAFKVKVIADGQCREVLSTPITISEAIKLAGFKLDDMDIVKTVPREKTIPNQEIEVIRVTQNNVESKEAIPFEIERTSDNTLERGLTKTVSAGKTGVAMNKIKITYHNGQEIKREVIGSKILQEPVNKVVALGTITTVSRGGMRLDFREARYMRASAYTYTGSNTATGKTPEVGMVAVDPGVIPMGSKLYIEGYGYAHAADTGGAIKGDRLDLFMEERAQCMSWGNRTVKVYVLE
ncbi:MAG: 3D domain-containing protein [Syntrophomonadaceae bacterium]|nr:3D domain-containing protein [Syntrophomonadaceae bacterium]MDD3024481.1 3D domain-containing protein [Syntrophomonadaceae bacterium]